ncbi:oxysterol binding family protein [Cavenderia fasciculata]|uniref:Oxysterol binding family protein n=1 Tax=Cavenderia fasciculata TaxID=261658 RepID=F4PK41_CACFS|nr:oxysterol binding family protein [Cavenderia fasciculata]EGG23965.1 oxysterol binding family protein [Cavenderia fasciculata]|eukprot:XP_004361816.1 oxysterol binding family protein [Cavenderia fasciculata]
MASIEVSDESISRNEEVNEEYENDDGVIEENNNNNNKDETPKDKKLKGAIQSIMKNMVSSKQPFSLPICFSEPRSFLEKLTDMGDYLDIFLGSSNMESSENRFLEILKFYLSSWMENQDVRSPFNPVIGETFSCKWNHSDGSSTEYIAEQLSHHPPETGFIMNNKTKSIIMHAYLQPTSKFWGNSLESTIEGNVIYLLPKYDEEYTANLPKIAVKGIVVGSLATELNGSTVLSCKKSGYYAEMEFKGRGLIAKSKNMMICKVRHPSSKRSLYTLEAKWDGTITILSSKTNKTTSFFDPSSIKKNEKIVEELSKQPENSSQRVWEHVIKNIIVDNEDEAQSQKHIVEENQRSIAKTREGQVWNPVHFTKTDVSYIHNQLNSLKKEMS